MRIACLQFAPQLGDVDNNMNRADAVLSKADPKNLDLLVLPELAFSGYNFKSLQHISPYLEPTASGMTSLWARTTALKYDCVVTAGYPEKVDVSLKWPASPEYYNSAITVNREGETIANYRKSFLYYTDETWALEGPEGFYDGHMDGLGNVAMGICMDLNPYKFEAPWSAWEFAYHVLHKEANLVILSMAWLTREDARSYSRSPKDPDMETLSYWLGRLEPVIRAETQGEIIVVFANRTGIEDDAVYAGTSAVLGIHDGEVKVYGILGRGEKELLVVDTNKRPQAKLVSEPNSAASQPTRSSETSGPSHNSIDSVMSDTTCQTAGSENTVYTTPDLDPVELIQKIEEAMAPVSPVDANSPSTFYAPQARYPEPEALKGTLKSSIGQPQISPAKSVSPAVGRPVSPKSRNASRNRMHEPSAPSPASSVSPTVGRTPSRNASRNRMHEPLEYSPANSVSPIVSRPPSQNASRNRRYDPSVPSPAKSVSPTIVQAPLPNSRNASRNRMHEQSEPSPAKSVSPSAGRYPSQNASQNRMHEPSEPTLALPDLAQKQQRRQQRGRRRNLNNVFSPTLPQPHSASAAPDKYQASFTMGPRSAYIESRPKSAMW